MIIYRVAIELKMTPAAVREMDPVDFNSLTLLMAADAKVASDRLNH